ncbi:hypothetical protein D9M68_294780 [compost metagenome]
MQNMPRMFSSTLRYFSAASQSPLEPPEACPSTGCGRVSRSTRYMIHASSRPGMQTMTNTQRQDGTTSSSWVAMIGASPRPSSGKNACWMPMFMPSREGCEASAVAAMEVGVKAPSATPITARISSSAPTPLASPENPASRENSTTEGMITLRRPMRSERRPMKIEEMPQASASTAEILPRS